jgi:hypothetical protein
VYSQTFGYEYKHTPISADRLEVAFGSDDTDTTTSIHLFIDAEVAFPNLIARLQEAFDAYQTGGMPGADDPADGDAAADDDTNDDTGGPQPPHGTPIP